MYIISHTVEKLHDPTGIIDGDRFEFLITFNVEEDDELFEPNGLELRVLIGQKETVNRIVTYFIKSIDTDKQLDIALDDDEESEILAFCSEKITDLPQF